PRARHRARAGRAHAGPADGPLGSPVHDPLAGAAGMKRTLALLAAVVVAGCGGGGGDDKPSASDQPKTETTRVEVIQSSGDGGVDPKALYKSESPGVVTVISLFSASGLSSVLGGDDNGGGGVGSGFVLNGDGEIATNAHVVTSGEGDAIKR